MQHRVFGLHQIRYNVDLVPYDLTWNVVAAVTPSRSVARACLSAVCSSQPPCCT